MSKKNFSKGLGSLLGETNNGPIEESIEQEEVKPKAKVGRPVTQTKEVTKSSQEGTKENETRATFIVNEDLLDKLKAIAYWERTLIKEVVNNALQDAVVKYEKKNGAIQLPQKK